MNTDNFLIKMNGCKVCMMAAKHGGVSKEIQEYLQETNFVLAHEIERAKKGNIHPAFKKFIESLIKSGYAPAYSLRPGVDDYHNAKVLLKPEVALAYSGFTYEKYIWVDPDGMVIHFGTSQASYKKIYNF